MTPLESMMCKNNLSKWENAAKFHLEIKYAFNFSYWVFSDCLGKLNDGIKMRKVFQS